MKTILLVEDDPFIIDVYYSQFKKEGYKILMAKSVEDALEKVNNNSPDLIILDLNLNSSRPGPQDGLDILRSIRRDLRFKNTKVIVNSNYNLKEYPELSELPELGVIKSFVKIESSPEEIINTIKETLK